MTARNGFSVLSSTLDVYGKKAVIRQRMCTRMHFILSLVFAVLYMYHLIQSSGVNTNLSILPGGTVPPNPTELLACETLDKGIQVLKERFDYVILDTAPMRMVTGTLVIGRVADLSVYVCRSGSFRL